MTRTAGRNSEMACSAPRGAAAPAMSDFIVSMDLDGFSDSPPGAKGDALPPEPPGPRPPPRRVLEPDQPRRVDRALADPENSAVALLRERLLVQYLGVKPAGRGDPPRPSGESDGHQVGRRGVDQVADERHRGRQYLRAVSAP